MAKNIIKALFAGDDDDENEGLPEAAEGATKEPVSRPRSLADAWERLAESNRKLEERLVAVEEAQARQAETAEALLENAKRQLEVLHVLGKFHEASEKRGREMENQLRGVPDVLRTLPSATREQAERLSEIAARLYEKAQDNTVNALKSAQANHQRAIEDLIDKSIGQSRTLVMYSVLILLSSLIFMVYMALQTAGG